MKYLGQTMMVSIYGIAFNTMVAKGLTKHPGLTQEMMNKIVSAENAKTLASNVVPQLRQILLGGLKAVYVVSIIVIIISILLNQTYKDRKIINK
jgi:magnesium-transporting ATPase (P-type)